MPRLSVDAAALAQRSDVTDVMSESPSSPPWHDELRLVDVPPPAPRPTAGRLPPGEPAAHAHGLRGGQATKREHEEVRRLREEARVWKERAMSAPKSARWDTESDLGSLGGGPVDSDDGSDGSNGSDGSDSGGSIGGTGRSSGLVDPAARARKQREVDLAFERLSKPRHQSRPARDRSMGKSPRRAQAASPHRQPMAQSSPALERRLAAETLGISNQGPWGSAVASPTRSGTVAYSPSTFDRTSAGGGSNIPGPRFRSPVKPRTARDSRARRRAASPAASATRQAVPDAETKAAVAAREAAAAPNLDAELEAAVRIASEMCAYNHLLLPSLVCTAAV